MRDGRSDEDEQRNDKRAGADHDEPVLLKLLADRVIKPVSVFAQMVLKAESRSRGTPRIRIEERMSLNKMKIRTTLV